MPCISGMTESVLAPCRKGMGDVGKQNGDVVVVRARVVTPEKCSIRIHFKSVEYSAHIKIFENSN